MFTYLPLLFVNVIIPWIWKFIFGGKIRPLEVLAAIGISLTISTVVIVGGYFGSIHDKEIISGSVTDKKREHGHYVESYSCHCVTDSKGATTCQTCYEDRYTVTWSVFSDIGSFQIDKLDKSSKRVYKSPDPKLYSNTQVGDPVSRSQFYNNYVKAAKHTLFRGMDEKKFTELIPQYPDHFYDIFKINRVLDVGYANVSDLPSWNRELSVWHKSWGPQRQANVIVLFVNVNDPEYATELTARWLGGKKNDVVIVVGVTQYPKIDWVRIVSWTSAEIFKVQLRDELTALGDLTDRSKFFNIVDHQLSTTFIRRDLKDFDYLKDDIEPPFWLVVLAMIVSIVCSLIVTILFHRHNLMIAGMSSVGRYRVFK